MWQKLRNAPISYSSGGQSSRWPLLATATCFPQQATFITITIAHYDHHCGHHHDHHCDYSHHQHRQNTLNTTTTTTTNTSTTINPTTNTTTTINSITRTGQANRDVLRHQRRSRHGSSHSHHRQQLCRVLQRSGLCHHLCHHRSHCLDCHHQSHHCHGFHKFFCHPSPIIVNKCNELPLHRRLVHHHHHHHRSSSSPSIISTIIVIIITDDQMKREKAVKRKEALEHAKREEEEARLAEVTIIIIIIINFWKLFLFLKIMDLTCVKNPHSYLWQIFHFFSKGWGTGGHSRDLKVRFCRKKKLVEPTTHVKYHSAAKYPHT